MFTDRERIDRYHDSLLQEDSFLNKMCIYRTARYYHIIKSPAVTLESTLSLALHSEYPARPLAYVYESGFVAPLVRLFPVDDDD